MRGLRIILSLLLCLTVPVAGWASLLNGPSCPQLHQYDSGHAVHAVHASSAAAPRLAPMADTHHHEHCGDQASHDRPGTPCKGDHCACGCDFGACSSSALSLLALPAVVFATRGGQQLAPGFDALAPASAGGSTLLRPPIS